MVHMTNWLNNLSSKQRESVYAAMREIGNIAERVAREAVQLSPRANELAIGSEHHRAFIKGESRQVFLQSLREGDDPRTAEIRAKEWAREVINAQNLKLSCHIHIADIHADDVIRQAREKVEQA